MDGARDEVDRFLGLSRDTMLAIFKHQTDRKDRLDDAVVQIHPKTFALLQDRQLLRLSIQLRVLDGNRRLGCEHLDHLLILLGKDGVFGTIIAWISDFIGEIEIAEDTALGFDRNTEK